MSKRILLLNVVVGSLFVLCASLGSLLVTYRVQPEPYMDEVFHVGQAQHYCDGQFHIWDPKITTPPGVYLLAAAVHRLTSLSCSPLFLRSLNVFMMVVLFVCCYLIGAHLNPRARYAPMFVALACCTLPVLLFCSTLYYTDVGSAAFLMLAYYASLKQAFAASGLFGAVAVLFRQNNIIWVGWSVAVSILRDYERQVPQRSHSALHLAGHTMGRFARVCRRHVSQLLLLVAFCALVAWNDYSLVLGDHQAHSVQLHGAQLLYFVAFAVGSHSVPAVVFMLPRALSRLVNRPLVSLGVVAVILMLVKYGTVVHEYILADNRHLMFYLWRRILDPYRYHLVPLYLLSFYAVLTMLRHQSMLWKLIFGSCVVGVLLPTPLLEFRYFIVPYLLLRIHSSVKAPFACALETVVNVCFHGTIVALFAWHPAKIMW